MTAARECRAHQQAARQSAAIRLLFFQARVSPCRGLTVPDLHLRGARCRERKRAKKDKKRRKKEKKKEKKVCLGTPPARGRRLVPGDLTRSRRLAGSEAAQKGEEGGEASAAQKGREGARGRARPAAGACSVIRRADSNFTQKACE